MAEPITDEKLANETIVAWNGVIGTEWRRKDFKSPAGMTTPIEYVPLARLTAERERAEKAERRFRDQVDYSVDLQRIIEALAKGHAIPEPATSARFHYDMAVAAEAKLTAAEAEAARLRSALEPLAKRADEWPHNTDKARVSVRLGDLRRARAALTPSRPNTEQEG